MEQSFPIFYSPLFAGHDTGPGHPENAGRLTAVVNHLKTSQQQAEAGSPTASWARAIRWVEPSARKVLSHVTRLHPPSYLASLEAFAQAGGGRIDADTVLSPKSYDLALLAVAAWLDSADWVGQHRSPAFALTRPPGHHAERDRAMGFCLLSNAAIAAHYALAHLGFKRVAILDWDVHHGNGTQSLVEANPDIAYCSFHQSPAYPGTGSARETGQHHNVLNVPLPPSSGFAEYEQRWESQAKPFLAAFKPELLIVSAGYDATQADPLAAILLQPADYGWFTQQCLQLTPNILFGLEGGYDYEALAESVAATIRTSILHQQT
jgi:acetoin utilization deacetylase AcuC-like enzyme